MTGEDLDRLTGERDGMAIAVALAAAAHLRDLEYLRRCERRWKTELRRWPAAQRRRFDESGHPLNHAREQLAHAEGKLRGRLFRWEELSVEVRAGLDAWIAERDRRAA